MNSLDNFVGGPADQLRGVNRPHQYGSVIDDDPATPRLPTRGDSVVVAASVRACCSSARCSTVRAPASCSWCSFPQLVSLRPRIVFLRGDDTAGAPKGAVRGSPLPRSRKAGRGHAP